MKQAEHERRPADRCPYCHDLITDKAELVACAACGARHHAACHQEHGACSACGEHAVLVRPVRSLARARRERPPRGSAIEVEPGDERVTYRWPRFRSKREGYLIVALLAVTVILIPLAVLVLISMQRGDPFEVTLGPEHLLLATAPSGIASRKETRARRKDVGAILLNRINGFPTLTVDVGVDRILVANHTMLKEPELEWLFEALQAWKAEG